MYCQHLEIRKLFIINDLTNGREVLPTAWSILIGYHVFLHSLIFCMVWSVGFICHQSLNFLTQ